VYEFKVAIGLSDSKVGINLMFDLYRYSLFMCFCTVEVPFARYLRMAVIL
jgi:hypothetical protein